MNPLIIIFQLTILITCIGHWPTSGQGQQKNIQTISINSMTMRWRYDNERIFFEMSAPTDGWVTIGFNTKKDIAGTYLLMGNIVNEQPKVVEHFTISAGNYKPIETFGIGSQVQDVDGIEKNGKTTLKFSLPIRAVSKYQKNLNRDLKYTLIMAYSREDDFQHHSMMRTSINVKL